MKQIRRYLKRQVFRDIARVVSWLQDVLGGGWGGGLTGADCVFGGGCPCGLGGVWLVWDAPEDCCGLGLTVEPCVFWVDFFF